MTRSKYYCDYCEKSFYDDPINRKRHISGISHQRNKALWYEAMERKEAEFFEEPKTVEPDIWCRQFLKKGTCSYGERCKYRHDAPPEPGNHSLTKETTNAESSEPKIAPSPSPSSSLPEGALSQVFAPLLVDLPPSLRPPTYGYLYPSDLPVVDWG